MTEPYPTDSTQTDLEAAARMDRISKTVFAPVYPAIAEDVTSRYGITSGTCVDIGSGPATLSIALARITDLYVHALDRSAHSYSIAKDNIEDAGLADRIFPVIGDVGSMPFPDDFADLVISRGSFFFWNDLAAAFNEIHRILKPGGCTHIGGGFGNPALKDEIFRQMAELSPEWRERRKKRFSPEKIRRVKTALKQSDASKYEITRTGTDFWINISKRSKRY